jgi:LmbE family N-acetylglucosaminyl deacetylase
MSVQGQLTRGKAVAQLVAVVVAHPDDEVLWIGSLLSKLRRWKLIHLTDGAPRDLRHALRAGFRAWQDYAATRQLELRDALRVIQGRPQQCICYDVPDQESAHHLVAVAERLRADLRGVRAVLTHAYEHGHPDHDSASFAVHAARALIARACEYSPEVIEFASYHARDGRLVSGEFWPEVDFPEFVVPMTANSHARKVRALQCFVSQQPSLQQFFPFPERLRAAPTYDFSRPAPPGYALYDSFGWKMTSSAWLETARQSLRRLGS